MSRPGGLQDVLRGLWGGINVSRLYLTLDYFFSLHRLNRNDHGIFHSRTSLQKLSTKVWGDKGINNR